VVVAELLPAWVQMPGHPTDPMPRRMAMGQLHRVMNSLNETLSS
jgi:hypothetical protein